MTKLVPTKAPALPLAEPVYTRDFKNRYSNILRLYFNQLDAIIQGLLGVNGAKYLQLPHIAASDSTNQYASANNTPTLVLWNTLESISGFTLTPGGYAIADQDGVYKIDYSLQFVNTDNVAHDVFVWLQTNGTLVPNSSSRFTVPSRKSVGNNGYVVAYSSVEFEISVSDEIRLWWATEKAYNTVGPVDGVYMEALAAQTLPYPRPANPSAVGSINFVSRLP
jgi:hypothetical protein